MESSLKGTIGELIAGFDRLISSGVSWTNALVRVFDEFTANMQRAPRLSYAHLREALVDQKYDGPAVRRGIQFLEQLESRILREHSGCDTDTLRLIIAQLWSSVLLTALLPRLYETFVDFNLGDPVCRSRYVDLLLRPLLVFLGD